MQIEINTSERTPIDWGATGSNEIVQNVILLINTLNYEVAYDRTLGIDGKYQDMPLEAAIAFVIAQIYEIIEQREPRATVEEVNFIGVSDDGDLTFKVVIDV